MKEYNNFYRTDIFETDQDNNSIYFIFGKYGKGYIVNDEKVKSKLIDLEGYKYFFLPIFKDLNHMKMGASVLPPILIPILILVFIIFVFGSFIYDLKDTNFSLLIFTVALASYPLILLFYFWRIKKVLKGCKVISKEQKQWIFNKKSLILDITRPKNLSFNEIKELFKFKK